MSQVALYHYWRSSCSWRVRWGFQIKKVAYEDRVINLVAGDQNSLAYKTKYPNGYIPAIELDGKHFGESLAILEWLEEKYPMPALLPQNSTDRLFVRQLASAIVSGIQPLQNLAVLKYWSADPAKQTQFAAHWIQTGLEKFEKLLQQGNPGTFCFGSSPTFADLCLVPQAYNAKRYGLNIDQFPMIKRIMEHCLTLPECDKSAPHNQPGAQPT